MEEHGGLVGFLYLEDDIVPLLDKGLELGIELGNALALGYGAHDDAEVLGLDALDELLESGTLFGRLDLRGYAHLVREGYEHEETTCKGELGGEAGTLGRDGLLGHLHHNLLTLLQDVGDAALLGQLGLAHRLGVGGEFPLVADYLFRILVVTVVVVTQVLIVKKSFFGRTYINKACIQAGHDLLYPSQVHVAHRE